MGVIIMVRFGRKLGQKRCDGGIGCEASERELIKQQKATSILHVRPLI